MIKLLSALLMTLLLSFTPNPSQQEKTYKISLTLLQYNQLINGLSSSELPAKTANQLIQEITTQVQAEMAKDTIKKK